MNAPLILPYKGKLPIIHPTAFIAPGAVVIGDVEIGAESNIWFGCVVRGDVNVGSSRVDLQACKLEYSIVSPK